MFKVGQKVRDNQGQEGRVTDVDVCEGKASYTVRFGKYELVRFAYELEAAVMATVKETLEVEACPGCGESERARRCLGCRHDFRFMP